MDDYVAVSFSGGKDSTAMLLHMIERGEHIDEVITADTGMEFPAMYDHINRVFAILDRRRIKHTTLRNEHTFLWLMTEKEISDEYGDHKGYGWASRKSRWCTKHLKTKLFSKYFQDLRKTHNVIHCVGLAADEVRRLDRTENKKADQRHPLVEWGWTEADCLRYCYDHGYDWDGLYEKFGRVSCWCCPLQPMSSLRTLYSEYPDLWEELQRMDLLVLSTGTSYGFKMDKTVDYFTKRFEVEDRRKALGVNCSSRNFYREIKRKELPKGQRTLDD